MERKNSKLGLGIIIGLMIAAIVGLGAYFICDNYVFDKKDNKNDTGVKPTPTATPVQTISEAEAKTLGEELYKYTVNVLFAGGRLVLSTDSSEYISSDSSDKCNQGIGCMKITNWEDVSSKFTKNLISKLDYTSYRKFSRVVIIDNVAYEYDGTAPRELEKINSVSVTSKEENKIVFTIEAEFKENGGLLMDDNGNIITEHSKDTATMIIVKENNKWKVDSLVESSLLLNSNVD